MESKKILDLNGKWKFKKSEGDTVKFLSEQGYSWITSKLVGSLMKGFYEKTENITMNASDYTCVEEGLPRNPKHKATIKLKIGSSEKIPYTYGANRIAKVSVSWNEKRDRLVFKTTDEQYPKVFYRYLEDEKTMVEEMHVADKDGNPMPGSLIQYFEKIE
mmetsp:Transcript_10104/g.14082  ORF Transcript_10104/g.14082 Transcript_10104/m.14082 type:complete len:160 (+) Transcript_10104:94-573(+)|eukprot:CAMPEP_0184482708 /NCGR_PEP_ID=MMETSP0113_2-20130426/4286_1 /TAXON_ID=91329 /ORGANISM="Norrisiella sphaerica, Strain BC52" /LENGTH=159 /DNA_ID=CAMNT_0026862605 /DNA_START=94 /DNA_END=573 /DNA_ORIENTATION=-